MHESSSSHRVLIRIIINNKNKTWIHAIQLMHLPPCCQTRRYNTHRSDLFFCALLSAPPLSRFPHHHSIIVINNHKPPPSPPSPPPHRHHEHRRTVDSCRTALAAFAILSNSSLQQTDFSAPPPLPAKDPHRIRHRNILLRTVNTTTTTTTTDHGFMQDGSCTLGHFVKLNQTAHTQIIHLSSLLSVPHRSHDPHYHSILVIKTINRPWIHEERLLHLPPFCQIHRYNRRPGQTAQERHSPK